MTRSWRSFVLACLLSLVLSAALAAVVPQEPSRFDGVAIPDPSLRVEIAAEKADGLPGYDQERVGWAAFKQAHGQGWSVYVDRRSGSPLLVEGQGIPWYPAGAPLDLPDLEAKARRFVEDNALLFKVSGQELRINAAASGEIDKDHWSLVFDRFVAGVPAENQRFIIYVTRGNVVAFGADRWGPLVAQRAVYDADGARALLHAHMGIGSQDTVAEIEPARLVYVSGPPEGAPEGAYLGPVGGGVEFKLAWRFVVRVAGERGTWVGKVDAVSGEVIALYDDNRYGQVRGGVYPVSNDQHGWDGTEQAGWPMPYADITINAVPATTNDMGMFTCSPAGYPAATHLAGPYIRVNDNCGAINESVTCDNDLDLLQGSGTDCIVPSGSSAGNTHSSRSSFYHLNRVMEKGRAWLPDNAWLRSQVVDNVNINSTCNAYWDGSVNFYKSGGGCRNTGEIAGVFVHEWGHGIDQNDGGGYDNPSEAYADVVAFLQTHVSCVGRGFFADDHNCSGYGDTCLNCSGIRDQDWDMRQSHQPATPQGFLRTYCGGGGGPCGKEEHCESYVAGETLWDLAVRDLPPLGLDTATAWQLADKLFYKSRKGSGGSAYNCSGSGTTSDGCGAGTWFTKLRTIDDDDGNLNNGTPHASAIFAAFNRHNIACGAANDASNQNTSSCPSLQKPTLTGQAGSGAAMLAWTAVPNAANYLVLRNDQSCDAGHTIIATVPAPATSYTDADTPNGFTANYAVQAQGANTACESALSNCVSITPQPTAGKIKLDRAAYGCSVTINISVLDSNIGAPTTTATIFSDSESSSETVLLTETAPSSANYAGVITTTSNASPTGDGLLRVANGDLITARYVDADDGQGGTNQLRQVTATADCVGPVISAVQSGGVTDTQATISWATSEDATTIVHWGPLKPPVNVRTASGYSTSHTVTLTGLQSCTVYYYWVESVDRSGNVAVDDRGGLYHHFETLGNFGSGLQNCHAGKFSILKSPVGCSDYVPLKVTDLDVNVSPVQVETVAVTLSSTTETVPETVLLTETGPNTSQFTGSAPTAGGAPVHGDGILQTAAGDVLTGTYHDRDDGSGEPAVSFATGLADCTAPVISALRVVSITDTSAAVQWTTSEPATSRVEWGSTPVLGHTQTNSSPTTSHSFTLQPLSECGAFYFRISVTDAYGSTRVLDAGGQPFVFSAYKIPGPLFRDTFESSTGWTLDGEWEIGTPQGKGSSPPDPASAFEGSKVLGHDLTGLGANPGDYEPRTSESATSPVIDASGLSQGRLMLRRWLNSGAGAISSIWVKKGATWEQVWYTNYTADSGWTLMNLDISQYADGNPALQIRIRQQGALGSTHASGWNVDRFVVKTGSTPDFDACGGCGGAPTFGGVVSAQDLNGCSDTGVGLSWTAAPAWGTGHAGSYAIYRDTNPNFVPSPGTLVASGITGTSYTDATAPNGVPLYYIVRAENDETCSTGPNNGGMVDANLVRAAVRDDLTQPAPGDVGGSLRVGAVNDAHARLGWGATTGAASYRVYHSQAAPGTFTQFASISALYYEDLNQMANGTTWYYLVRAADSCGNVGP